MAREAQSIKAQVYVPGKEKGRGLQRQLTFQKISEWIRLQGLDNYTTDGLIELAAKYPTQALPNFRKNFNLMIQRVRQQRKKELGQMPPEEEITKPMAKEPVELGIDDSSNDGLTVVYT